MPVCERKQHCSKAVSAYDFDRSEKLRVSVHTFYTTNAQIISRLYTYPPPFKKIIHISVKPNRLRKPCFFQNIHLGCLLESLKFSAVL